MQTFVRGVGVFLLACLIAVAILIVGQALWGGLVLANLKLSPAIPWAAVVMIPLLAAMVMAIPKRSQWGSAQCNSLPDVRCPPNPDHHSPVLTNRKLRRCRRHCA